MVEVVSLVNGFLVFIEKFGGYIDFKDLVFEVVIGCWEIVTRNLGLGKVFGS
jgi:hypothetical protein